MKKDIRTISSTELEEFLLKNNQKSFVAKQVMEWLWKKSKTSFEEMKNISKSNRELLDSNYIINSIDSEEIQVSSDKTIKTKFKLFDGYTVEGVLIPQNKRMTACISSQVGCSLSCKFCATGTMDRKRNLSAGEIYDQVVHIRRQAKENYNFSLSNIVYMGMGEPLLNYSNVIQSIDYLTSSKGLNISKRRITLSTSGISKMIKKLADDNIGVNLALSLHAASDEKRNQIMPIGESNSLNSLKKALEYYYSKMKKQLTYEYILFNDFNDSIEDAKNLYSFTKHTPSKVNIIEYNPIENGQYEKSSDLRMNHFISFLENKGVVIKVRRSRGKDIDAACGQLANKKRLKN